MIGWVNFTKHDPFDVLGFIPSFISEDDPRSAKEQIDDKYISGWNKFDGFTLDFGKMQLKYPGDPAMNVRAMCIFRQEVLVLFDHSWFAIIQPDGSYEVARLD